MPDPRQQLGIAAEAAVATWLTGAGWRILARRCRSPGGGEVDILAIDPGDVLVAIEVRARRSARTGSAIETLDRRRVGRLSRTLAGVAAQAGVPHAGLRVDLVGVEPVTGAPGRWRLRRIAGIGPL